MPWADGLRWRRTAAGRHRSRGVKRRAIIAGRMKRLRLELFHAVESGRFRDDHVAQLDHVADPAGRAGGDDELWLDLGNQLLPQQGNRHFRPVLAQMQLGFEAHDGLVGDSCREPAPQSVRPPRRRAATD